MAKFILLVFRKKKKEVSLLPVLDVFSLSATFEGVLAKE